MTGAAPNQVLIAPQEVPVAFKIVSEQAVKLKHGRNFNRCVARSSLLPLKNGRVMAMLEAEAQILKESKHPNIIRLLATEVGL